jgi:hypothetical protein
LVQIKAPEIKAPNIDPETRAVNELEKNKKYEFMITRKLGKSVPMIEITANCAALFWALAKGKISCMQASPKDIATADKSTELFIKKTRTAAIIKYKEIICLNHLRMLGRESASKT